ncbi:DUF6000 family protein [Nocardia sp. NPDC058497]|uniref:DUF6000 family protein n=1 Tax=Nocardia sp. NPDC058497 TaxID=3346529 RepID=UPI0036553C99
MAFRDPTTQEDRALVQRWVIGDFGRPGRYMKLLGLNPLRDRPDRDQLEAGLARDAREITDAELRKLLELDWRPRLTAAWLIALDRRIRFREELAELLLGDEVVHAGFGYCFAFARFGTAADADILVEYLNGDIPGVHRHSRTPAVHALLTIDDRLGTGHAARFLEAFGYRQPPSAAEHLIDPLCALAEQIRAQRY